MDKLEEKTPWTRETNKKPFSLLLLLPLLPRLWLECKLQLVSFSFYLLFLEYRLAIFVMVYIEYSLFSGQCSQCPSSTIQYSYTTWLFQLVDSCFPYNIQTERCGVAKTYKMYVCHICSRYFVNEYSRPLIQKHP